MKTNYRLKFLRLIIPLVILFLFFSMGPGASATGVLAGISSSEPGQSNDLIGLHVQSSTRERIAITLTSPAFAALLPWIQSPGSPNASFGDVNLTTEAGRPQLPVYRALVGIPSQASYALNILSQPSRTYGEEYIPVVAQVEPLSESDPILPEELAKLVPNETYPSQVVKIVEEAWIRDQRVVVLEFYPVQLSQGSKEVRYYSNLVAELVFTYPAPTASKQAVELAELIDPDIYDSVLSNMILNYESAAEWQASPDFIPMVDTFPIADGIPGLKIVVDHAGIYQVTYEDLVSKGMDPGTIDPAYLHLQNIESEIAYEFLGDADNLFEAGESLRFYGEPLPALRLQAMYNETMKPWISLCPACDLKELFENYTNENVYWLLVGDIPGKRIQQVSGLPSNQYPVPEVFTDTRYAEEDLIWYSRHFTSSDAWFWTNAKVSTTTPVTYALPITLGVVAESGPNAKIKGEIYSVNYANHHSSFYLNASPILDAYWLGIQRYVFTSTLPLSLLHEGQNLLDWQTSYVDAPENQYFDRYQIEYSHKFAAINDRLAFNYTLSGRWQYEVTGLVNSDYALVYDITDPLAPVRIQDVQLITDDIGTKAAFEWAHEAPVSIYFAGSSSIESPKSLTWYQPPELEPAGGADYIFITHRDFIPQVQVLADYRASQGLRTLVVDVADVYDQFGYGIYHPIAIRNYLERALLTWQGERPEYALLVGDGTFEIRQRDNIYVDEPITMPPALAVTDPYQGEMDATNLLAAVIGTDIMPDLAIGRIPAKTTDQVAEVVKKTILYEQASIDAWQRNIIYIADNTDPAGNFEAFSDELQTHYPPEGFTAEKFYVSAYCTLPTSSCPALPAAIVNALNTKSALFVNYAGHGSAAYWAASPTAFDREKIDLLTNKDRLPVILSWTCLDGFFFYPVRTDSFGSSFTPSLVEKWLFSTDKGAVATFSSAGLGVGTGHDFLAAGFYTSVFTNGNWNLGAASLSAKANLYRTGVFQDLINGYMVFGDPALQLASSYRMSVTPAMLSGLDDPGKILQYTIKVDNTGALSDSYYLTASGNNWPVGVPALVGPVAAGSQVNVIVSILVPFTADAGDQDQVTIQVVSKGDLLQTGSVQITTTATDGPQSIFRVLVPVILGP
jgi:hypothetical protein